MSELYPADEALLALAEDEATGVPYIETGASPYFLAYRRMLYRLLRASERANDLRVFAAEGLAVGVRAGRCVIGGQGLSFAGSSSVALSAGVTQWVWLDDQGAVQVSASGLPSDRSTFLPLAEVVAGDDEVLSVVDLRGEAFLQVASTAALGFSATAAEIDQALDGIGTTVTAGRLDTLTNGGNANALHEHTQSFWDEDALAAFTLFNNSAGASAGVGLRFALPGVLPADTELKVDRGSGFVVQSHNGVAHHLLGSVSVQQVLRGALTASVNGEVLGAVPVSGELVGLVVSAANNVESSASSDGISVALRRNGAVVTSSPAVLTSADGAGFVCTDQGDGTAAVVHGGTPLAVSRGDVLSVDVTLNTSGTVTQDMTDVVLSAVVRAAQPE